MCYFLYGAVNKGNKESDETGKNSVYHFSVGTGDDVNRCTAVCGTAFRITSRSCDCGTAIGAHESGRKELTDLSEQICAFKKIRGIKHIFLSKNWVGKKNSREETVHIDEIDLPLFLADIEDNCLYKIQLYPKFY